MAGPRFRRTPLDFALIFAGMTLLALLSAVTVWQFWHVNRLFSGVSVAGVPVGGLTRAAAVSKVNTDTSFFAAPPISLYAETMSGDRQWPLPVEQFDLRFNVADAVNQAYLLGREGTVTMRLGQQLGLALRGYNVLPVVNFDPAELRYVVSNIAATVRQPGRAALTIDNITVAAQPGLDVDEQATIDAVVEALVSAPDSPHIRVPLVTIPMPPPDAGTTPGSSTQAVASDDQTLPFLLRDPLSGMDLALDPSVLSRVMFSRVPLRLDRDVLRAYLMGIAEEIDMPARDARLRFNAATGGVTVIQSSKYGQRLDVDATASAVETALVEGANEAVLALAELPPAVDMNRIAEMGIRELVASGTSYFAGSSAARVRNIQVGAEKLDGVVIPPGEDFSFNKYVEDVSAANGFEDSLIIWGDRTAVGVGGGVCQVSTTIFRAAYQAGLPIVERYNHGYVVSWYGEPGLDATIYTPTVDFRFRNDTSAYLLIEPSVDVAGGSITFSLYGTKPDREVLIGEPVIADVEEPEKPAYKVDEELVIGDIQQVEWPKEGMTVTVERTIVERGVRRVDTMSSRYQPWRAVYLVGPGTEVPDGEG